ncbi:hypothetical protein ACIO3O_39210 [Streptomyces sp. NPDC087440]|uniref:hypothetical protein n=1 Tax=Streptomyces sp. NPDC087440 TaxID=3365790 RepID=UPI0038093CAB
MFHSAGTAVTVVERQDTLLGPQGESVARLHEDADAQWDLRLGQEKQTDAVRDHFAGSPGQEHGALRT